MHYSAHIKHKYLEKTTSGAFASKYLLDLRSCPSRVGFLFENSLSFYLLCYMLMLVGLENFSSNCFLNVALQILLNLVQYNDLLLQKFSQEQTNPLVFFYLELYFELRKQKNQVLSPIKLYKYLVNQKYIHNGHQGDYHEIFLHLSDELSRVQRALNLSPTFDDLITMKIQKTIKCPICQHKNIATDLISSIPIINSNIGNSLIALTETVYLDDYKCEKCANTGSTSIESEIRDLPQLLYFHHIHKNPKPIHFIEKYHLKIGSNTTNYQLYMLIYHKGSQHGGHYYLRLYREDNQIYQINDEVVTRVEKQSVADRINAGTESNQDIASLIYLKY